MNLLCNFVQQLDYPHKMGIISGTGDRRDEDIRELGAISARCFDEIIIRCDKNLRGRQPEEIVNLLQEGLVSVKPDIPIKVIINENEAIDYAYRHAPEGSLVTIMCDVVAGALDKLKSLKDGQEAVPA